MSEKVFISNEIPLCKQDIEDIVTNLTTSHINNLKKLNEKVPGNIKSLINPKLQRKEYVDLIRSD